MAARDYLLNNFWWKLLSLLLAGLTWLTIYTALKREQSLKHSLKQAPMVSSSKRTFRAVPITLVTSSTNNSRFRIDPATTTLEISGPEDQLLKLQERDIHVYIDLSDVGDEKQLRRNIQAQVPRDLKLERLDPPYTAVERVLNAK